MKLGILASHPIQYQAPLFRALSKEMDVRVFFAHRATPRDQANAGFGVEFEWDSDLLSGYTHTFLKNASKNPSTERFFGCDTPEIRQAIIASQFDAFLVGGWNLKCYWQAVAACREKRIPVLVRGDSQLPTERSFLKGLAKQATHRLLLSCFDACLVVGHRSLEYFLHYGVPAEKIWRVPHSVDNEWFAARSRMTAEEKAGFRRDQGVAQGSTLLLFVGKLIPKKRPLDLVRALRGLKDKGILAEALFVGAGVLEREIVSEARALGVTVHMAGFKNQSELPRYYAASDLLVLPSDAGETWGLVVNEAFACGLPAIVSCASGCSRDLINANQTGRVYETGDVSGLADAVSEMLPRIGTRFVKEGLAQVASDYSITESVTGLKRALKGVTRQPGSSAGSPRILVLVGSAIVFGHEKANIRIFSALKDGGVPSLFVTNALWGYRYLQPALDDVGLNWVGAAYFNRFVKATRLKRMIRILRDVLKGSASLLRIARSFRPTHVHVGNLDYFLNMLPALWLLRRPVIYRLGDAPDIHNGFHRFIWMRLIIPIVTMFVCNSKFLEAKLLALGVPAQRIRRIYSSPQGRTGPRNTVFPPVLDSVVTVCYLGQFNSQKGVELFVEAAQRICREREDVRFIVAGNYSWNNVLAEALVSAVEKNGLSGRIFFPGYVREPFDVLDVSQIHVCPSVWEEPLANVVLEAKLVGIPSVVFRSGGLPEVVRHGVDGFICPEKTVESLKAGIDYFLSDSAVRKKAGEEATASLKFFGAEHSTLQWKEVFESTEHDFSQRMIWERHAADVTPEKVLQMVRHPEPFQKEFSAYLNSLAGAGPYPKKICEMGCEFGVTLLLLDESKFSLYGLDLNRHALALLSSAAGALDRWVVLTREDMFSTSFGNASFDIVFNSGVLEHVGFDERRRALAECARIVKPGGHVLIGVPNHYSFPYRLSYLLRRFFRRWPYPPENAIRSLDGEIRGLPLRKSRELFFDKNSVFMLLPSAFGLRRFFRWLDRFLHFQPYLRVFEFVCLSDGDAVWKTELVPPKLLKRLPVLMRNPFEIGRCVAAMRNQIVFSDAEHLKLCYDWLLEAQKKWNNGGYAASYGLFTRWAPSYLETTGYLIPTMLDGADHLGDPRLRESALKAGEWLLAQQMPNGAYAGIDSPFEPVVFDTGQILIGLMRLVRETGDARYLEAARSAGGWLAKAQNADGSWGVGSQGVCVAYHTRVAAALLDLSRLTNAECYRAAGVKSLEWTMRLQRPAGLFERSSLRLGEPALLHTMMYVLEGFLMAYEIDRDKRWLAVVEAGATPLRDQTSTLFPTPFANYDADYKPVDQQKCLPGMAQWACLAFDLHRLTGDARYLKAAQLSLYYLKSKQILKGGRALKGGLPASVPLWGRYHPASLVNWGSKFFADALIKHAPHERSLWEEQELWSKTCAEMCLDGGAWEKTSLAFELLDKKVLEWTESALRPNEGKPAVLLDLGCGPGRYVKYFQKRYPNFEVIGVDPLAPDWPPLRRGSAYRIPLSDASVDVIFSFIVFQHLAYPDVALTEIKRVLKNDGILLIGDRDRYSGRGLLKAYHEIKGKWCYPWDSPFLERWYTRHAWSELLRRNGFRPVDIRRLANPGDKGWRHLLGMNRFLLIGARKAERI